LPEVPAKERQKLVKVPKETGLSPLGILEGVMLFGRNG
jgi:hypothetical protein